MALPRGPCKDPNEARPAQRGANWASMKTLRCLREVGLGTSGIGFAMKIMCFGPSEALGLPGEVGLGHARRFGLHGSLRCIGLEIARANMTLRRYPPGRGYGRKHETPSCRQ